MPPVYQNMLFQSSNIQLEDKATNNPERWSQPKMHVGRVCPLSRHKTQDIAMIATFKPEDARFRDREQELCSWLRTSPTTIQMEHYGTAGTMCPGLSEGKLGLHVRGDTPSSSRLFDSTLLSGTVPVFAREEQFAALPSWIDWDRISYFVDVATATSSAVVSGAKDGRRFVANIEQILGDGETYNKKLELVLANRHLFDVTGPYVFDTYMYMLQAALYPETRRDAAQLFGIWEKSSILNLMS